MSQIAILLSGHVRNIHEHINNLKENLLDILLKNNYQFDIYIHTWDDNLTRDIIYNKDKFFKHKFSDIPTLFENHKIPLKKIMIENQEKKYQKLDINNYLDKTCKKPYLNGKYEQKQLRDLTKKLFWQFYGHHKSLKMITSIHNYSHIIKTRPDVYYEPFDISLLNYDCFFPNSHRYNGICINQIFFGGKKDIMIKILGYFREIIYNSQKEIEDSLASTYRKSNLTFNTLFKHYISNILKIEPQYTNYNPRLYRNKNQIQIIH